MKELVGSVVNAIKSRNSSPFFGYFIFSWFSWNFNIIHIITSSNLDYYEKVDEIEAIEWIYFHTAIAPAIVATLIFILLPKLYIELDKISEKDELVRIATIKELNQKRYSAENPKLVTEEIERLDTLLADAKLTISERDGRLASSKEEHKKSLQELQSSYVDVIDKKLHKNLQSINTSMQMVIGEKFTEIKSLKKELSTLQGHYDERNEVLESLYKLQHPSHESKGQLSITSIKSLLPGLKL